MPTTFSDAELADRKASVLSAEERERAERFAFSKDQRSYITAHWLVRRVLSCYVPVAPEAWEFARGLQGKPVLIGPDEGLGLLFNLSHTAGMVACAVTQLGEVGVDVETVRPREHLNLARRYFAPLEISQLEPLVAVNQANAFFRLWTLKEAYIKARGIGLAMDLASFGFPNVCGEEITIEFAEGVDDSPVHWSFFRHEPDACHKIAVAVRHGTEAVPALQVFQDIPSGESRGQSLQ
jgi:4'-phosphopantetheinyl transferase